VSGPIVRKYGFPNFEQIFGKRELEHGVEENKTPAQEPDKQASQKVEPVPKKDEKRD